ncbi:MAG: hypothetical protein EOO02_15455, partial [Chitinophagaceae bacterium]
MHLHRIAIFLLLIFSLPTAISVIADPGSNSLKEQSKTLKVDDADLETIRTRIISDLQQPAVKKDEIQTLITTIREDGTWPGINYVDTSRTGFEHRFHLENMLTLARALSKKGSPYLDDATVKKTLVTAFDFWLSKDFRCQNWWWNEMGTRQLMINIMMLM